jgi:ribonucleoside-diphosphate reductase alpha chain
MSVNNFDSTGTPEYSAFIHRSRYARWLPDEGRREAWSETVDRYISFFKEKEPSVASEIEKLRAPIQCLEALPSMRALFSAGPALERDAVSSFNCSYVTLDHPRAFDEILYILACGTGVGFSCERQYVSKLPVIADDFYPSDTVITVPDSRIGWAKSFRELISLLYVGHMPKWDMSKVRAAGTPLKTFGGRASGPGPLEDLFRFTTNLFRNAAGRRLHSIECHDLVCKTGEVVIAGGVRRSALISLSNPSDDRMRLAKSGQWWVQSPHRALANNSACFTEKPDFEVFLREWVSLHESRSGERGFFSR